MGWRPDLQGEVPDAGGPAAGQHDSWEHQEACLAVLPDQDGALPDRAVAQLDFLADERCGSGTRLPLHHGCGKAGAGRGDAVSEVSEAELREFLGELGAGAEEPGAGDHTVLSHTRLRGVCRHGLGSGRRFSFVFSFALHAALRSFLL